MVETDAAERRVAGRCGAGCDLAYCHPVRHWAIVSALGFWAITRLNTSDLPIPAASPTGATARDRRSGAAFDAVVAWLWLVAVALSPVWFGANTPVVWSAHA